jgi:peptide deformylase
MRANVYQKLHEFNQHIDQAVDSLRSMSQIKNVDSKEIQRYAEHFEELRSSSSGYLASVVFEQEEHLSGKLFRKRRHQEMADDPMHGGWLEEERAKKQKPSRKAKSSSKKSVHRKNSPST